MGASIAFPIGIDQNSSRIKLGSAARVPRRWERSLERRQVFSLQAAERVNLACLTGLLWVTLDRDGSDYVVAPGQALRLPAGVGATIQALASARFGVSPA